MFLEARVLEAELYIHLKTPRTLIGRVDFATT